MFDVYYKKSYSKMFLFVFIFIIFLILSACNNDLGEIKQVNVYKMENFDKIKKNSLVSFKSNQEIKEFEKAFNNLKKQKGKVDIIDPEYKIELGNKSYFMWLNQEKVTVMNTEDTNTIYFLTDENSEIIKKILDTNK